MGFEGILKFISEKFAEAKIRYALIGGLALHAAGYSRSTGDVDLRRRDCRSIRRTPNGMPCYAPKVKA